MNLGMKNEGRIRIGGAGFLEQVGEHYGNDRSDKNGALLLDALRNDHTSVDRTDHSP